MRIAIITSLLLLPQLLRAQEFKPGTFGLLAEPTKPYRGQLAVRGTHLLVQEESATTKRYKAEEVRYVRFTDRRYRPISGFVGGRKLNVIKPTLVPMLDSGQVTLMIYYQVNVSFGPGANGHTVMNGNPAVYLLHRAGEEYPVALPDAGASRGGKNFREALLPYVAQRPDLVKLLTDKEIVTDNLPYFIHALNTGQPFTTED